MPSLFTSLKSVPVDLNHTAIIIPSEASPTILSHRQFRDQVLLFQQKLAASGIGPRSVVAIAQTNTLDFAVAFLAITFQRAIAAPLNPAYKQEEFEFYLDDLKAALLLVPQGSIKDESGAVKAARTCGAGVAEIYWDGDEVVLDLGERGHLESREHWHTATPEDNDIALILHTSGTTGRPKIVPLTHKNLTTTILNIQTTYALTSEDRTLLVMPLFHVHGLLAGLLTPLMTGGSIIIPARFSASGFWRDFIAHKANWYTAVPTVHQILLKSPLPTPMPAIRFIRSCSSPLAPTISRQIELLFNAPVLEAYAMTEAAHQMTSNPLPPGIRKAGSVGTPQGIGLIVADDDGNPVPRNQVGEVCVQGENVTSGYLGDPKVVQSPFTDRGYLRTGDQGYLDNEGYLILTGRIKELINKGGEKISPIEIDNTFAQHPGILEAVSFAIDDELYGQEVAVAIVRRDNFELSTEQLLSWFGEKAAKFKIPKKVYFTENMPKTATGKVQRRLVAQAMMEQEKKIVEDKETARINEKSEMKMPTANVVALDHITHESPNMNIAVA
ncbi:hypothetical protein BP6252_04909 [Coleophoma cylindrospora]|uniref:Acetyl-CoA synthetase-like protein n=1 Tax=Coleophoma cylindrospora TaxID=1849047 RepID=A0A3D8S2E5_9HELO|nr:hypothetical protein BP6252_04909 [Coleophoma cylindrospora]